MVPHASSNESDPISFMVHHVSGNEYDISSFVVLHVPSYQSDTISFVVPKAQKFVLDAALLYTQHYKEQSQERNSALLYLGVVVIEKDSSGCL